MAMSDCIKCWDTPCTCGYEWKKYNTIEQLEEHIKMIQKIIDEKKEEQNNGL